MNVVILDGVALAAQRRAGIARRAADITRQRGRAPSLLLLAFADESGRAPHIAGKQREAGALGIQTVVRTLDAQVAPRSAVQVLRSAVAEHRPDAVFVQVPFPEGVDGDAVAAAIPVELDIDVMSPDSVAAYMSGSAQLPPVTVTAATLLLDACAVEIAQRRGALVADDSAFAQMFREELVRRGADVPGLIDPASPDLPARVRDAGLVVAAAGWPWLLHTEMFARGAIALDIGYFNGGGRGDIALRGVAHLDAIMPVPGGVGPMTVSALMERVVDFAHGPNADERARTV